MSGDSPKHTTLDVQIQVPWRDGFEIGDCIDALSGKTTHRALEDIPPLQPTDKGHKTRTDSHVIHKLHEQRAETRVHTAATINLGSPATLDAKFNYKQSRDFSSSSFMVEHWVEGHYAPQQVPKHDLNLTSEAKAYVVENPGAFRERYGDYFICGFQSFYSFRAMVNFKAATHKSIRDVEAGAKAGVKNIFSLGGDAGHSLSNQEDTVVESVYIRQDGCDDISPTMPPLSSSVDIKEAADISRQVQQPSISSRRGSPKIALLKHYSDLDKSLPREVPISRDVFSKLHGMDDACTKLELDFSHPAIDPEENFAASSAINLFREERETFIDNPDARETAYQKLQSATQEVELLLRLYGHLLRIDGLLSEKSPPKTDGGIIAKAHWEYGYGLAHDEVVDAGSKVKVRAVRLGHGLGGWECLLKAKSERGLVNQFSNHNDRLYFMDRTTRPRGELPPNEYSSERVVTIVGFRLSCDNAHGESVEFTIKTGGILKSSLLVDVIAPHGCEWHCRIYFVGYELGELASRLGMVDS